MNEPTSNAEHASASKILFLHLPKTAGTALRELFARQYGEQHVTRPLAAQLLHEALIRYADYEVISGHFKPEHGACLPADRLTLTVLREPIDRFLSYYWFRKHDAANGAVDPRVRELPLDAYIQALCDDDLDELNAQTHMLYPIGADAMDALPWPQQAMAACRALDAFDLVGVQAEIDDFVAMLGARLGWPADMRLERVNVTQRREPHSLSEASRQRLNNILAPDIAVYAHALERFRTLRREAIAGGPRVTTTAPRARPPASTPTAPRDIGDRRVEFSCVRVSGAASGLGTVMVGEQMTIDLEFEAHQTTTQLAIGFVIRDERGLPVFGTNSLLLGRTCTVEPGRYRVSFSLLNRIESGNYTIDASLTRNGSPNLGCHHLKEQAFRFDVHVMATPYFQGRVMMDPSLEFATLSPHGRIDAPPASYVPSRIALSVGRLNPPLKDFRASLRPLQSIGKTSKGTELLVELEITNSGVQAWPGDGKQPVCISYHWLDEGGAMVEFDGVRSRLPRDVAPGETLRAVCFVRVPQCSGALRLCWTLVQEGVGWFDGRCPESAVTVDVEVA